jgi:hypothetical protein
MTNDQASIILSIQPIQWQTLAELIEHERQIIGQQLDSPGNSRDLDQFYKGGRAFGLQVMGYQDMAHKVLNPKKEGEE